jgi:[acyl-carrier-protein] S-malonyltransferase
VFPGQGSQSVGMGKACADEFAEARAAFAAADRVLGFSLSRLCWEGPDAELQLTANTQPAVLTMSIAVYRVLEAQGLRPDVVAGHSLGEYSALVAAEALTLEDAVTLVRRRGELMQQAVPAGVGAMAAFLAVEESMVRDIAATAAGDQVCAVTNLNAPGQTVIGGHREAVERAVEEAKRRGARKVTLLPVSAPFHSPLMAPARVGMEPLLAAVPLRDPRIPVVCNVDARPLTSADDVRDALLRQIDQPVRWVESVECMRHQLGVVSFVEVGPGRALAGMIKRIVSDASTTSVSDPASVRELLAA